MGCQCLGPKRSHQQVYLTLIQQIHHDATETDLAACQQPQESIKLHNNLMERMTKKGDLRKLIDNLSSRRHKAQDGLVFNLKILTQAKDIKSLCAGLIIADSITEVIYSKKTTIKTDMARTASDSSILTFSVRQDSKISQSTEGREWKNMPLIRNCSPNQGVDEQYFRTIIYLLQKSQIIKPVVLGSLNSFAIRHMGVAACEFQVWKIIEKIVDQIKIRKNLQTNCQTFRNTLLLTREHPSQYMKNQSILQNLILLWLQESSKISMVKNLCFQILQIYFTRFISCWESQFLYECLFNVFDAIQFDSIKQPLLQKLSEDLVEDEELSPTFQRAMFNYLLGYLTIVEDSSSCACRKWLVMTLNIKKEANKLQFVNSMKDSVKIAGMSRFNSWIDKQYVNISEFCTYNSRALIYFFIVNLTTNKGNEVIVSVLKEFSKFVNKMSGDIQMIFMERCIDEICNEQLSKKEHNAILSLMQQIKKSKKFNKQKFCSLQYCIPIEQEYSHQQKVDLLDTNKFLLNLSYSNVLEQSTQIKLSELLYSFFENLIALRYNFEQKYQFLTKTIDFIQILHDKLFRSTCFVFFEFVCSKLQQLKKTLSIQSQLCLLILGFNLKKILLNQQLPAKLYNLILQINKADKKQKCLPEINRYFFEKDILNAEQITEKILVSQKQLEEYRKIMGKLFNENNFRKSQSMEKVQRKQSMFTVRKNSTPSVIENQSCSSNDRSFEDVLQVLDFK